MDKNKRNAMLKQHPKFTEASELICTVMLQVASIVDYYGNKETGLCLDEIVELMHDKGWNDSEKLIKEVLDYGEKLGIFTFINDIDDEGHFDEKFKLNENLDADKPIKKLKKVDSIELNKTRLWRRRQRREKARKARMKQELERAERDKKSPKVGRRRNFKD